MDEYDAREMSHRLLYQVTLASGHVVTRPEDFEVSAPSLEAYFQPIFAEDGRLLTVEADEVRRAAEA